MILQFLCMESSQTSCPSTQASSSQEPSPGSAPWQPQLQSPPICKWSWLKFQEEGGILISKTKYGFHLTFFYNI